MPMVGSQRRISRLIRRVMVAVLIVLAVLPPATLARAASFTVTKTTDTNGTCNSGVDCSLREAIAAANSLSGGPHTITVPAGSYAITAIGTGALVIDGNVVIVGAGVGSTILDGENARTVLQVNPAKQLTLSGATVRNGLASTPSSHGGGIYVNGGTVTLTNVPLSGNHAVLGDGGAIYSTGVSTVTLTNVTVSGNSARFGGGIFGDGLDATMTLNNVIVSGNSSGAGGGIYSNGPFSMTNATVSGNQSTSAGGGMTIRMATLTNVTVHSNSGQTGGGIYGSGELTMTNVTVSGNTASYEGGGVVNAFRTITLINVTVSGNSAPPNRGALVNDVGPGTVTAKNTIVAGNPSGGDCSGTVTTQGGNLDSDGSCGFNQTTDRPNMDPLLGPLGDHGGLTDTMPLLRGSPARDAGVSAGCPSTDQRGVARPQDGDGDAVARCDIGAYEAANSPTTITLAPGALTLVVDSAPLPVDPTLGLVDTDNPSLAGATVAVSGNYVNGEDVLTLTPPSGITGNFAPLTGVLTLSGTATVADYQAALRSTTYAKTSEAPRGAVRTIT